MTRRKGSVKYEVWSVGCNHCMDYQHGIYSDKTLAEMKVDAVKGRQGPECKAIVRIFETSEWVDA